MVDSCRTCPSCARGLEQYCVHFPTLTYNAPDRHSGGVTYGGYFRSASTSGTAVFGWATAETGDVSRAALWLKHALDHGFRLVADAPVLRQPAVRWFFASLLFHVMAHFAVYAYFSLYLDALGYSKATIGALWAVSVVVEIAWFYAQGRLIRRFAMEKWLVICAVAVVLRMALTGGLGGWIAALVGFAGCDTGVLGRQWGAPSRRSPHLRT